MNGVEERYEIKLKQTSKGTWYCDGLTVNDALVTSMLDKADTIMKGVEKMLADHNKETE